MKDTHIRHVLGTAGPENMRVSASRFISANELLTGITVIICFVQVLREKIKVTSDTKYQSQWFFIYSGLNQYAVTKQLKIVAKNKLLNMLQMVAEGNGKRLALISRV